MWITSLGCTNLHYFLTEGDTDKSAQKIVFCLLLYLSIGMLGCDRTPGSSSIMLCQGRVSWSVRKRFLGSGLWVWIRLPRAVGMTPSCQSSSSIWTMLSSHMEYSLRSHESHWTVYDSKVWWKQAMSTGKGLRYDCVMLHLSQCPHSTWAWKTCAWYNNTDINVAGWQRKHEMQPSTPRRKILNDQVLCHMSFCWLRTLY